MSVRSGSSPRLSPPLRYGLVASCAVSLLSAGVGAAAADDPDMSGQLQALADVTAQSSDPATDVLGNVAQVPTTENGDTAVDATVDGTDIVVPTDPSDPLSLASTASDTSFEVTLPCANQAGHADSGAPGRFDYGLSLDPGSTLVIDADGVVEVLDASGAMTAGVAPAWAKDASGADVPTHYEVSGSTLTQVVDHSSPGIAYPVVADPFLGINLLSGVWKNRPGG